MMTYNPYAPNPYIQQGQQQDIGGLAPVFQNIGAQQSQLNQAMAQNQGLSQQVGMGGGGGFNNLAMAAMLRKGQSSNPYANAQAAMKQYGAENVYGYGGQGQVPTMTTGEN
jgi:hypothetical protein